MYRVCALLVAAIAALLPAGNCSTISMAATPRVTAIGDSVMLGALPQLQQRGIEVYAAKDRAFIGGLDVVQQLRASGGLRPEVVIHLGANGPVSDALFEGMMTTLRGSRRVVFLTVKAPVPWEGEVNATLRRGVRRWHQARLLDWHGYASAHPRWLAGDEIHLTQSGARAYAALVAQVMR